MKRTLAIIISILMIISSLTCFVYAAGDEYRVLDFINDKTYVAGDADGNQTVNALDAYAIKNSIVNEIEVDSTDGADINADGNVTARDLLLLKGVLSGKVEQSEIEGLTQVYSLTIGGFSIKEFDIVVPAGTDLTKENVGLGAVLLQLYIEKCAGIKLNIVEDKSTKEHGIILHAIEPNSTTADEIDLGLEGYTYIVTDGNLDIYGTLRGNMYAVYEIIEEYLGIRFFSNDYTYSYKLRASDIPEGTNRHYNPPMEFRYCGGVGNENNAYYCAYTANHLNGTQIYSYGGSIDGYQTGPHFINAHAFGVFKRMQLGTLSNDTTKSLRKRLEDKYSEGGRIIDETGKARYYAYEWQPCTSSPEAYYEMYNGMLEVLEMIQGWGHLYTEEIANLGIYSFSFSINDNGNYCTCRLCNAKANGRKVRMNPTAEQLKFLEGYTGDYTYSGGYVTFKAETYSGLYLDFTNRAAREVTTGYHGYEYTLEGLNPVDEGVRKIYENLKLYLIIYAHTIPESVKPEENIILMYCGHGCNNHILGSGECSASGTSLNTSNTINEYSMKAWADLCHRSGAKIWYWSYGVNYHYFLTPCPNIPDFYYNMVYIYDYCKFDGIYYESCSGPHSNFEDLKQYLACEMSWEPDMSYDNFVDTVKEFMYMYYGDGYEEIYEYMLMQTAAGDANGCFVNNWDRPFNFYNEQYIHDNYETMRNLILTAIDKADSDYHKTNCRQLFQSIELLGLSATYTDHYVNGTKTQRNEYQARYTAFYNYLVENADIIWTEPEDEQYCGMPSDDELYDNPIIIYYGQAKWA